ncbi:MAG: 3-deoxy-manno-octulosonate cytidylyltransferase [Planctomycetaceae bacterium]|jgi:3-deoxy-manno-octulosonate cytidylyltransferase (CMP-KDO synthetase)|nr:3-deoxy-manno-octulosonate cytidylyltransferase [Planctomycetaceae bacterium]
MNSVIIIPARYASTRLPQKLLLNQTGKTLIQHTYEAASKAALPESVTVACDHPAIYDAVKSFGGSVVMTDPNARSGTDRIAEVAAQLDADIIVNVQGDEPEISGAAIDTAVRILIDNPSAVMSTLAAPIRSRQYLEDPSCVKAVFDSSGKALYFSRSVIPHPRGGITEEHLTREPPLFYQHIGLYAYRREFLLHLSQLPPSALEQTESLEQLRVLHHGCGIQVAVIAEAAAGIDTAEDYNRFVKRNRLTT